MIIYAVAVEHRAPFDACRTIVSPVCAYTDKEEAEKHIHSVQQDVFGDTYYFWQALVVKDRYESDGPDIPGSLENQRYSD